MEYGLVLRLTKRGCRLRVGARGAGNLEVASALSKASVEEQPQRLMVNLPLNISALVIDLHRPTRIQFLYARTSA